MYTVFTDGASKGNPGPGGWGVIIADTAQVHEYGGMATHTTNNEMELVAVCEALSRIPKKKHLTLYTDSAYVVNGITKWITSWEKRNWKNVKNAELWRRLSTLVIDRRIEWNRVSGHSGLPGNMRVDTIASAFAQGKDISLYTGKRSGYGVNVADMSYTTKHTDKKTRSRGIAYSYISLADDLIEVHATWDECKKRVSGVSKARFQKSLSKEDEKRIIASFKK